MIKIKVLPDYRDRADKVDFHKNTLISLKDSRVIGNEVYLDGELEYDVNYDECTIFADRTSEIVKSYSEYEYRVGNICKNVKPENTLYKLHFTGKADVELLGIDKPAKGYFWVTDETPVQGILPDGTIHHFMVWRQKGLIFYADDKEAQQHAEEALRKKSIMY